MYLFISMGPNQVHMAKLRESKSMVFRTWIRCAALNRLFVDIWFSPSRSTGRLMLICFPVFDWQSQDWFQNNRMLAHKFVMQMLICWCFCYFCLSHFSLIRSIILSCATDIAMTYDDDETHIEQRFYWNDKRKKDETSSASSTHTHTRAQRFAKHEKTQERKTE